MKDYIRELYDYNYALHRRLWDSIAHITDEQFRQPIDYSFGSIQNHMLHLLGIDKRWIARVKGEPLPPYLEAEDYPTRESVREQWDIAEAYVLDYIETVDETELQRILHFNIPHRGGDKTCTVRQVLVHVVNHGTDHRAQILPVLHRLGAPTFEQDLMLYLWDKEKS